MFLCLDPYLLRLLRCSVNAELITRWCFPGFVSLLRCPCRNLDHLDLVVYLMMRTQRPCPSQRIFLYITSCCSSTHLSSVLSSFLYAHPLIFPFGSSAFLIKGFMLSSPSSVSFQRDTCCCMLPLCRIAEFSCLRSLISSSTLSLTHLHTTDAYFPTHSRRSRSFPSRWVSISLPECNTCTHAPDFQAFEFQERQESPLHLFQYTQAPSQPPQSTTLIPTFLL